MNGKMVDISGANTDPEAEVIMYGQNGADNQQWYQDEEGIIRSKINDFALDASGRLSHNINISLVYTTLISGHVRITVIGGTLLGIDNNDFRAYKDNSN